MTDKLLTAFLTRNSIRVSSPLLEHFWETSTHRALALARQDRSFTETENAAHKTDHSVAGALVAEHLVTLHEGAAAQREWALHSADCLACLAIDEAEVDGWLDDLHPVFESVALG